MNRYLITICVISLINISTGESIPSNTISTEEVRNEQASNVMELDQDTFYNYTRTGNHFVMFFVPWCAHSNRLQPTWQELANSREFEEKLQFSRVDCDANNELCDDYNVEAYPTLMWIKNGYEISTYKGKRDFTFVSAFVRMMLRREIVADSPSN